MIRQVVTLSRHACLAPLAVLAFLVGDGSHAAPSRPSPFPDAGERAAFQRAELERSAAFHRAREARSALHDRFDVTYYRLDLDLRDLAGQTLQGDVTVRFRPVGAPLDTLALDLRSSMAVTAVISGETAVTYSQSGMELRIVPAAPFSEGSVHEIRVLYGGHPMPTGYGAFVYTDHLGTPLVASLSEPEGAREWWPCKDQPDDKADSLDVFVRVPSWMTATSNGLRVSTTAHGDGSLTFHWQHRYPITTYLVSVTATNFTRIQDTHVFAPGDTMPLEHYVFPEHLAAATEDLSITSDALTVLGERYGRYPFDDEKYGHSISNFGGGMEHQTNTSYGSALIRGDHRYDWVVVHELSHQWWGDMTSPADWRDIWLNEGFASHAEALFFEATQGAEAYRTYMVEQQSVTDPSGPIYDPNPLFGGNTVYNKGAWVLHMLRGVLGDERFFGALADYRSTTAFRSTTTAEFQSIVEASSGEDLDWFFQPWIYGINRPHYEVSFLPISTGGAHAVAVHLGQTQTGWGFFPMPVRLEITLAAGEPVRTIFWNDPSHLDLEIGLASPVVDVHVDPEDWILKTVATASYTMNITTTDLPIAVSGSAVDVHLVGRGGTSSYAWAPVGSLPPGLSLDASTGRLSGTAPAAGVYPFVVQLQDGASHVDTQGYVWTVLPATTAVPPADAAPPALLAAPVPSAREVRLTVAVEPGEPIGLVIYDAAGRRVKELWRGAAPGRTLVWSGADDRGRRMPPGVYFAELARAHGRTERRRVLIVR